MAKIFEETPTNNQNLGSLGQNSQTNSQIPNNSQSPNTQENKGFFKIPENLLQFVPLIPFALESMTGQKIPPMGGTMAEIQLTIQQIVIGLQTVLINQEQIAKRIMSLETNANLQLTNITQQVQSFRLTHTKERKEVEYNPSKNLEAHE